MCSRFALRIISRGSNDCNAVAKKHFTCIRSACFDAPSSWGNASARTWSVCFRARLPLIAFSCTTNAVSDCFNALLNSLCIAQSLLFINITKCMYRNRLFRLSNWFIHRGIFPGFPLCFLRIDSCATVRVLNEEEDGMCCAFRRTWAKAQFSLFAFGKLETAFVSFQFSKKPRSSFGVIVNLKYRNTAWNILPGNRARLQLQDSVKLPHLQLAVFNLCCSDSWDFA